MKPNDESIERTVAEFLAARPIRAEGELSQIETAIFLEETFGFVLSDAEISELDPDDSDLIGRIVREKMNA